MTEARLYDLALPLVYFMLLKLVFLFIYVLLSVAFVTLMERKILSYMQKRKGPNKMGFKGILQPFNDAIKLLSKEFFNLSMSNLSIYTFSPIAMLMISLLMWLTFPSLTGSVSMMMPLIFILCCLSSGVYPILGSGWSSNSKYAMLGSLRAVAQTISYEVSLVIIILSLVTLSNSFSLVKLMSSMKISMMLTMLPMMMLWFTSALAETNRTPFDFSEGESELVSGFNTEYMSSGFVLFFLAEYSSILFMSLLFSVMFFYPPDLFMALSASIILISMVFIWVRGTLPRLRYDKLMMLAWKIFLPLALFYLLLFSSISFSMVFMEF
uniref:NADH-ubiquinone oxidoreductase chain 1 n=1 Tax=Armadillidium album TaxID=96802 RepID=A0A1P8DKK4_9CRUS|nr:NADH dehydrogenase subunit 1 [Armadillidium album]